MSESEFITYLTSLGFNVYPDANHMPDVDEKRLPAMFVFATGGFSSDPDIPIRYPAFQIIVKGKNFKTDPTQMAKTQELAMQLINALDQKNNYVIGNNTIYYSRSQQSSPLPIGLDLYDRPVFSTNFNFKLQPNLKGVL